MDHIVRNISETKESFLSKSQKDFEKISKNLEKLGKKAN